MKLKILNSCSAGNCYVFDNGREALVVECGMPLSDVKKAVDFDITRISGCIITHEHGDHSKYVRQFIDARIEVGMSKGTSDSLGLKDNKIFQEMQIYTFGNFKIMPFETQHDCAEPFGYLINHPEMGTVLFATDTYYLKHKFSNLNNILIECNYRSDILEQNIANGRIPNVLRERTLQSHMSYQTCLETLLANDLRAVNNIVLIHLSDGNSNAEQFKQGIHEATGKTVHVAEKGLTINFNKTPF